MLGTAAHLVWWTSVREPERVVQVVTVPAAASPDVHVHVHQAKGEGKRHGHRPGVEAMTAKRGAEASCHRSERRAKQRALASTRGAVVCSSHGCTIRRSFVERMLRDPGLLGPTARVQGVQGPSEGAQGLRVLGVHPGSVPDLLGLRSGDVITEIDGVPMRAPSDLARVGASLAERDGIALTLQRGELRHMLRYRVIDG